MNSAFEIALLVLGLLVFIIFLGLLRTKKFAKKITDACTPLWGADMLELPGMTIGESLRLILTFICYVGALGCSVTLILIIINAARG